MDQRIVDFYNRYHTRRLTYPGLYLSGPDSINVILPNNLLEYANAAAGHSGFGAGARARGIRRQVANAATALAKIFASPDNLLAFLESSEKNAEAYVEGVRAKHLSLPTAKADPKASDEFWNRYGKNELQYLTNKFGRAAVQRAYSTLTISEFENMFGLSQEMEVA